MMNNSDIVVTPEPLRFTDLSGQKQSSCAGHLDAIGMNMGSLHKDQTKVMAHLFPTQIMNMRSGATEAQPACTLPQHMLPSYNDRRRSCQIASRNRLNQAFGDKNIVKGCVMKTADPDKLFPGQETYKTTGQVKDFLTNAAWALDTDSREYLLYLKRRKNELQDTLNTLSQELEGLKTASERAREAYNKERGVCDQEIAEYNSRQGGASTPPVYNGPSKASLQAIIQQARNAEYQKNMAYIRNIRELSFVSLLSLGTQDFVGQLPVAEIPSGKQLAFMNWYVNYITLNDLAMGTHRKGSGEMSSYDNFVEISTNWNDVTRTVFIPPGMDCQLFEHIHFAGEHIGWFNIEDNDSSTILPTFHTLKGAGWDRKISSAHVKGAFKSRVPDTYAFVHATIAAAEGVLNMMK